MQESPPFCSVFLFINSSSGGGLGSKLLHQQIQKVQFQLDLTFPEVQQPHPSSLKNIDVYFFNMRTDRDVGFGKLKGCVQRSEKSIIVVCGGDGTIIWVVQELRKHGIDARRVPIAVIPLGTGNDFSQYLGWGKCKNTLIEHSYKSLKKLIRKWMAAKVEEFDIWDVETEVYPNGKFEKVNKEFENELIPGQTFNRSFCNYFSFGMDGKIGYSFDMHRTTSRLGNLMVYAFMGLAKAATKTKKLNQLVSRMTLRQENENEDDIGEEGRIDSPKQGIQTPSQIHEIGFSQISTDSKLYKPRLIQTKESTKKISTLNINIQKDYYNLVALNIDSFMGGVRQIWKNAKNNQNANKFSNPSSFDGKLEFVGFSSSVGMAMQRALGGFAEKISQGGGPYDIQFKSYPQESKHRTYLQIDGQFIRFTHPKRVSIKKSKLSVDGKIRVLRNIHQK